MNNEFPVVIKDVLPLEQYFLLNDDLSSNWILNNSSYSGGKRNWGIKNHLKSDFSFLSSSSYVKLKIKKILKKDIKLCKIHVNGQTSNQESEFHIDFPHDNVWTFILFCGDVWDASWGGEFVCYNKKNNKYEYVPCFPNSGALIPSNWEHYGSCPNSKTDKLRISVAFSFCETLMYNIIMNEYPHFRIFS